MYSVCILIYVYIYLYSYWATQGVSGLAAGGAREQINVRLKMMIEWTDRYTWRLLLSERRDSPGGQDRVCLVMHWVALIDWTQRCTCRLRLSEVGDAHGGHECANLDGIIGQVWRCPSKSCSSELRDAHGGCNRVSLKMDLEAKIKLNTEMHKEAMIECVRRCTWRPKWCNAEMHYAAVIDWVCRSTCRPWSIEIGGVLGCGQSAGGRQ